MTIRLLDPTGSVAKIERREEHRIESLTGKRVAFVFNQHRSALDFWNALEREVEKKFKPSAAHRLYKENTWAPAPRAEMDQLMRKTDYALVGMGA
jgi:hypothetical protein